MNDCIEKWICTVTLRVRNPFGRSCFRPQVALLITLVVWGMPPVLHGEEKKIEWLHAEPTKDNTLLKVPGCKTLGEPIFAASVDAAIGLATLHLADKVQLTPTVQMTEVLAKGWVQSSHTIAPIQASNAPFQNQTFEFKAPSSGTVARVDFFYPGQLDEKYNTHVTHSVSITSDTAEGEGDADAGEGDVATDVFEATWVGYTVQLWKCGVGPPPLEWGREEHNMANSTYFHRNGKKVARFRDNFAGLSAAVAEHPPAFELAQKAESLALRSRPRRIIGGTFVALSLASITSMIVGLINVDDDWGLYTTICSGAAVTIFLAAGAPLSLKGYRLAENAINDGMNAMYSYNEYLVEVEKTSSIKTVP